MEILERISGGLDERRLVGTRLLVRRRTTVADRGGQRARPGAVRPGRGPDDVLRALYRLLRPADRRPGRHGWPFGRSVQAHEVHAALARIPGVDMAQEVSVALFPADADTGRRSAAVQRLDLPPTGLVFSYEHQVRVRR